MNDFQAVPSDMRDLDFRIFHEPDLALKQAEPAAFFHFVTFFKEHLHAQADAQQWLALRGFALDRIDQGPLSSRLRMQSRKAPTPGRMMPSAAVS